MGVTYEAYTIIGSRIDPDNLYIYEKVSVHQNCPSGGGSGKFCPDCGKTTKEVETMQTPIERYDDEYKFGSLREPDYKELNGLKVVSIRQGYEESNYVITNINSVSDWNNHPDKMDYVNLDECRKKVKAALEPAGLWDPEKFGIWTVLYCS